MAFDIAAIIAKAGLTGEAAEAAQKAFSSDSLKAAIEETAMHTANEAFKAERDKMNSNWDIANAEYVAMQAKVGELETKIGATQAEKDAAAKKLADAEKKMADLSTFDPVKQREEILAEATKKFNEFNVGARS